MTKKQQWNSSSIDWQDLRPERLVDNEELFYLVTTASFIETTSDLYTRNLIQHFADNAEVSEWLEHSWEPEELVHGGALREYTNRVWPEFDWDTQYAKFFGDYSAVSKPELLLPERSLELVSRCVVEIGTASYYTALHHASNEPVLAQLTRNIYEDEVRHYKYFYKFFRQYRDVENTSRTQVLGALWHRMKMIEDEDTYLVLKHVHCTRHPEEPYNRRVYKEVIARCRKLAGRHFPHEMSVNMLLKPLDMKPLLRRMVQPVVQGVAKLMVN